MTQSQSKDNIEQLITKLGDKLDLTCEDIADVLWLTLELQKFEAKQDNYSTNKSTEKSDIPSNPTDKSINSTPANPTQQNPSSVLLESKASVSSFSSSGENQGLKIAIPDPPSLREPLTFAYALRPLMRRVATGRQLILDEAATVKRIAEERIFVPVMQAELEPWLDLALVIDESHSMLIWGHIIIELKEMFSKYGIFRDIRVWGLQPDETGEKLQLFSRMGGKKRLIEPKEIIDPTGRCLILIVSDCVSNIWRKGMMFPVLKYWTQKQPVAILQMLPEWMWRRTALDLGTAVGFKSSIMGAANQELSLHKPLRRSRSIGFKLEERSKIPVITLDREKANQWCQMLIGKADALVPGYLLPQSLELEEENAVTLDTNEADGIVRNFRMTASPLSRELAGLLAASPVIVLPVVRLIQESLLPKSSQIQVAEVFLGGLLKPKAASLEKLENEQLAHKTDLNPDLVEYEFIEPRIRDIFLDDAPVSDSVDVVNAVSRYVAEQIGYSLSEFMAILKAPQKVDEKQREDTIKPFAEITAKVLRKLGGEYVEFAKQIEIAHKKEELGEDIEIQQKLYKSVNPVMIQFFHWYNPSDGTFWTEVQNKAQELVDKGFTAVWLPPAYKGVGGAYDVGYGVYDLFDLGEFDQKGSIRTKYGTRQQYVNAIKALQDSGIKVYADVVLNYKMGGDSAETFNATPFSPDNRLNPKGDLQEIKSYTHFNFPGRQGDYSQFEWHWWHFDGIDYNEYQSYDHNTVYLVEGKVFDDNAALEKGNLAYRMGCGLDLQDEFVRREITDWGKWYLDTTGVDGFRLDAIKHISASFFPQWLDDLEKHVGKDLFGVGEYWVNDINTLNEYIDSVGGRMSVFDVPLHYNFHLASKSGGNYDMQRILDGTLMQQRPTHAITFVENHDSQPLQALESVVEPWFKPLAYAIILLRQEGYPCVFYADYYGAEYNDKGYDIYMPSHEWLIDKLLYARQHYAYGPQYDYFDNSNIIGWTRLGNEQHPQAMAVIMSDSTEGSKWMEVGKKNTRFVDETQYIREPMYTNDDGWGEFRCKGGSVSVWLEEQLLS